MSKKHRKKAASQAQLTPPAASQQHEIGRGTIGHNAMAAMVTSPLFQARTMTAKKGKGAYSRKGNKQGLEPFQNAA
ncbi:alternative ribosome rescue factor ArfA [Ferrimonas pelagia]|uniref:alternative ribosome rescue factor ArfA n=1 Tax=Ferrimonas pelagia TaxID=1177826 RepID=UPI003CD069CC